MFEKLGSKIAKLAKNWSVVLCYAVITLVYFWPFLQQPAWNLIDDGLTLQTAQTLTQRLDVSTWQQTLVETSSGRLRPFYFLFFVPIYVLAGTHPFLYWLTQALVVFLTLCLLWKVIAVHSQDNVIARTVPLIFLFHPAVSENLARLGTAEPHQFLAILICVWWLSWWLQQQQTKWGQVVGVVVGVFLYLTALFFKENSVVLLPIIWLLVGSKLITERKWWVSRLALMLGSSCLTILFLLAIPKAAGYTQAYHTSFKQMISTMLTLRLEQADLFWPLSLILLLTGSRLSTEWLILRRSQFRQLIQSLTWPAVCLLGAGATFLLLLPWEYARLDRYFYPIWGWVLLYAGVELWQSWQTWQKISAPKIRAILAGIFLISAIGSLVVIFHGWGWRWDKTVQRSLAAQQRLFLEYQAADPVIQFLLEKMQPDAQFLVWHEDYERVLHLGTFASRLGQQPVTIWTGVQELTSQNPSRFRYLDQADFTASLSTFTKKCSRQCYVIYRTGSVSNSAENELLAEGWETVMLDERGVEPTEWQVWSLLEPHRD